MEQPTQAEALRTAAQAAYELLSSGLFNIPDEKYCVVTALAESLRGSQQAERAVPAALPGGVWYVPCTAGAGTTEGAYQEGWNACIKAMLAATVQQAAPAGDAEREAFEAWAKSAGFPIRRLPHPESGRDYGIDSAQDAWEAWQARAAIASQQP